MEYSAIPFRQSTVSPVIDPGASGAGRTSKSSTEAALVPQALLAVTVSVPLVVSPKVTDVVAPAKRVLPFKVQAYELASGTAAIVNVVVAPAQSKGAEVIGPGVAGVSSTAMASVRGLLLPQLLLATTLKVPLPGGVKSIEVPLPGRLPRPVKDHV
jgi:hypothetical protein